MAWVLSAILVASIEVTIDPLTAWEHLLEVLFGLLIPTMALFMALGLYWQLASPEQPMALAARHGADRRRRLLPATAAALGLAMLLTCAALVLSRQFCRPATEALLNRDLALCCGIGCLATGAYIAYLLVATRLGIGRTGAWVAFGIDLTLGHIDGGWSMLAPHRYVVNLIGHPGIFTWSAKASSWILLGFMVVGLAIGVARTPR
jgi:hypothetical protein